MKCPEYSYSNAPASMEWNYPAAYKQVFLAI